MKRCQSQPHSHSANSFVGVMLAAFMLVTASALAASNTQPASIIPAVHGTTFSDAKVDLPEDLRGRSAILVIGFSQNSREAVTAWGKRLAIDYYDSPNVLYYEMPVLAAVPRLLRGYVTNKIKSDVSDRGKPHFLPLVDNEISWRALAHYTKPDDPYILLIDSTGHVRWQSQGPPSDTTYAQLKQQVVDLNPH